MNTNNIEMLLVGLAATAVSLTLFIYLGHLVLNFLKISAPPRILQSRINSDAKASGRGNLRRKIESKPTIICSLPMHQEARQEMPLY